jgi:hypothetical protein
MALTKEAVMSESSATSVEQSKPAGGGGIFIGLIPWVLFTIIAEHGTLKAGSIGALVIAIGVCVYSARGGKRPKMIELAAVVTFIVFTVIAFTADPSVTHWLTRYARAVAAAVLALLVFGSLAFVPFTEEYARESVPRQYWTSPKFKAVNRRITVLWGTVFTVMTASHIVAGEADKRITNIIFNWAIPIALVIWGINHSRPADDEQPVAQTA